MVGKPTIPPAVHAKIRKLAKAGHSERSLVELCGVSLYTVRKALKGDEFLEAERARHRAMGADRYKARKTDPAYLEYQAAANALPERREKVRQAMAALRAARRKGE